jgi:hypothetical protein
LIQMDLGRPKNQISWNQTKPTPLHWSRRFDSGHFFFLKMDTVCISYRDLKIMSNMQKSQSQSQQVKFNIDVSITS